jgi:hypothetical protein
MSCNRQIINTEHTTDIWETALYSVIKTSMDFKFTCFCVRKIAVYANMRSRIHNIRKKNSYSNNIQQKKK